MAFTASPKLALKRGALITAANWHVVLVQFIADAVFTALLAVPVVGGAVLVVLTSGLDPQTLFQQGVRRAVPAVAAALLAHPLALDGVDLAFAFASRPAAVTIEARVRTTGRTGVEMEALTAVQIGLLTIYDMCKAADRGMCMTDVRLLEKHGGKSGSFLAT